MASLKGAAAVVALVVIAVLAWAGTRKAKEGEAPPSGELGAGEASVIGITFRVNDKEVR